MFSTIQIAFVEHESQIRSCCRHRHIQIVSNIANRAFPIADVLADLLAGVVSALVVVRVVAGPFCGRLCCKLIGHP